MVNSISAGVTDAAAGAAAMKKATGMNKDDFLKLFVAQVQNQDPLKPQDGTQFLAQLAQLTQVEQAYNSNTNLQKLIDAQNNAATFSAVSFIGKDVLTEGSQIALTEGAQPVLNYRMPEIADQVRLEIKDSNGKAVRALTVGRSAAGDSSIAWDGRDSNNQPLPAGLYTFSVTGTGSDGKIIAGTSLMQGRVDGVKMDGAYPVLIIGGTDVPLSSVLKVKGV